MANESANPAKLKWMNRVAKRHADEINFRPMAPWVIGKGRRKILSLPAETFEWEKAYAAMFPDNSADFYGLEEVAPLHRRMKAYAKTLVSDKNYRYEAIGKPMKALEFMNLWPALQEKPFNMIYLDWMGTWGRDKDAQIRAMFKNGLLARHSLFRFTIGLARGRDDCWTHAATSPTDFHIVDIRGGGGKLPEWKMYGVPQRVIDTAEEYGRVAKLVTAQVYSTFTSIKRPGTPEVSFLFKVV